MKSISKFEHDIFINYYSYNTYCAVNKQKYSLEEAEGIAKKEFWNNFVRIDDGYVRYRVYYDDDNYKNIGWVYEESQHLTKKRKRSCLSCICI